MANEEHLEILKQGSNVWNAWREKNPDIIPDFFRANLTGADLIKTDLRKARLVEANLISANLWRADLTEANLRRADLTKAKLVEAKLEGAIFREAILKRVDLRRADLKRANLSEAYLRRADLSKADLRWADFGWANLISLEIFETNFDGTIFYGTVLSDIDLSEAKGLETVKHEGPSTIGIDTIYRSKGKIPESFLRGVGVPETFIQYIALLVGEAKAIEFYSCFISYSSKDEVFSQRLYADLLAKGLRVWFFPESAKWGKTIWGEIDKAIRIYDKLIVVCSENSLQSEPVIREIERALQKEDKEKKHVLFPITLDDYIFDKWEHERKADVLKYVVGRDFQGWDKDASIYNKAFKKLMDALEKED